MIEFVDETAIWRNRLSGGTYNLARTMLAANITGIIVAVQPGPYCAYCSPSAPMGARVSPYGNDRTVGGLPARSSVAAT
jgi:hypothetical protein